MKLFVEFDEEGLVEGFTYAYNDLPVTDTSVEIKSPEGIYVGMKRVGDEWVDTKKSIEERSYIVRAERDVRVLEEVDPIVSNALRWATLDVETQQLWAAYRQALLDVPNQAGFPTDVTWPTKP